LPGAALVPGTEKLPGKRGRSHSEGTSWQEGERFKGDGDGVRGGVDVPEPVDDRKEPQMADGVADMQVLGTHIA
jgi:hypothetical protein